jgi:hypothetical protein
MGKEDGIRDEQIDRLGDPGRYRRGDANRKNRLIWEKPLGTIRGPLDEPGPRFVDVEGEAELDAMRWERGIGTSNSGRAMARQTDPLR